MRIFFIFSVFHGNTGIIIGILMAHNHPGGDPQPGNHDIKMIEQLVKAGKLMGIKVLDHVIIGGKEYCSLADCGYISC